MAKNLHFINKAAGRVGLSGLPFASLAMKRIILFLMLALLPSACVAVDFDGLCLSS